MGNGVENLILRSQRIRKELHEDYEWLKIKAQSDIIKNQRLQKLAGRYRESCSPTSGKNSVRKKARLHNLSSGRFHRLIVNRL